MFGVSDKNTKIVFEEGREPGFVASESLDITCAFLKR